MEETFTQALKDKRIGLVLADSGFDNWVSPTKGVDLNEMVFNHTDGKPRRYIIVRKKIEDRPKASTKLYHNSELIN